MTDPVRVVEIENFRRRTNRFDVDPTRGDLERGFGVGSLQGIVTQDGGPLRRWVHLFLEAPGRMSGAKEWIRNKYHIASTRSDAVTGAWEFRELDEDRFYTLLSFDHEGVYDPIAKGGITPGGGQIHELTFEHNPAAPVSDQWLPSYPVFNTVMRRSGPESPTLVQSRAWGNGKLRVNVSEDGGPLRRWVHCFVEAPWRNPGNKELGILYYVASLRSDPNTGVCEFKNLDESRTYTLQAYDITGQYDPVIKAGLIPEPM